MSENDNFLDILGEISDDLITDAITPVRKKRNDTIKLFMVFAAVFMFVICGILIRNSLTQTDYSISTEKTAFTDNYEESTEYFPGNNYDITSEEATGEELFSEDKTTQTTQTAAISQPETSDAVVSAEIEPSAQEAPTDKADDIIFNDTDAVSLFYTDTDILPDKYTVKEKTDFYTLEKIYGTKILPSYLPSLQSNSMLTYSVEDKYTVYYAEDRSDVYCSNTFRFILKNGNILDIHSSNKKTSSVTAENENAVISYIGSTPVLIFRSTDSKILSVLCAYLSKDGCYFRIQLSGISASKDEFIKIIASLTEDPES